MGKRIAALVVFALSIVPTYGRVAERSQADVWRAELSDAARQLGVRAEDLLASELSLRLPDASGGLVEHRKTVDQWIEAFGTHPMEAGAAGLPEVTAGDFGHLYLSVGLDVDPGYNVTTSAVVPATPPVYPPSPADLLVFEAGGPLTQVKGSYTAGFHSVGTLIGSNVDTGASGPYLPVVNSGVVPDASIDFIGHVALLEQEGVCLLGICVVYAGALIGDGAVIWDTADPSVPIVP